MNILIVYSTTDGQTLRIAEFLRDCWLAQGATAVALVPLAEADAEMLAAYDGIVLGASVRYGKHRPAVGEFVHRHAALLDAKRSAFFSVCAIARKPEKRTVAGNVYVRKFLARIPWQPPLLGIFGGRIHYALYKPLDRFLIRLIMRITGGPTAADANVEFTDWQEVRAFATAFMRQEEAK